MIPYLVWYFRLHFTAPTPGSNATLFIRHVIDDGAVFRIPFELMRVYSPSAEVQGHGPGQEVLQTGKRDVTIESVQPVGHYAVQPRFSDGHDSGLYTFDYLRRIADEASAASSLAILASGPTSLPAS